MKAISVKKLVKYYRYGVRGVGIRALGGVSLDVEEGEVFGLLGPNGAGKSTLVKVILGLLRQNSGTCEIFGKAPSRNAKGQIGYLPESPYFYKFMTGFEMVKFYAKLCGMTEREARSASEKALELVGLGDASGRRISLYSKGMTQRAGIAQAIAHNPKLVILDEPASGLDPIGAEDMAKIVRKLRDEGKTVLLCSHSMSEVEKLCSRVAILCGGEVAACGRLDELLETPDKMKIEFKNLDAQKARKISNYAAEIGAETESVSKSKISLDEFFRKIVEGNKK